MGQPPLPGKCISLADVSGDSAASAAGAAERCKAALAAEPYDFILYSSENEPLLVATTMTWSGATRALRRSGRRIKIAVDDPNRTCVFCHFGDEAQNNARGAEDAKHKYEKLRAQEAQQAYQAAAARREAGHEDVSERREGLRGRADGTAGVGRQPRRNSSASCGCARSTCGRCSSVRAATRC